MRITILAVGSRGDVEPSIALGVRLQQRGHQVRIGAFDTFHDPITDRGLAFASLGSLPASARRRADQTIGESSARHAGLRGRLRFWLHLSRLIEVNAPAFLTACGDAELILHTRLALVAPHIAERLQIPCIAAYAVPGTPTREFAHPSYSGRLGEGRASIAASYAVDSALSNHLPLAMVNRLRIGIGLRPIARWSLRSWQEQQIAAHVFPVSPSVVPAPHDWPDNRHITGFWYEADHTTWTPPPALARFLDAGPPPLAIGFGSMLPHDSAATVRIVAEALERTGTRAVLLSGWGQLKSTGLGTDRLLTVDSAPHSWLFPRVSAAVHHGGAGTSAAAMRAGIPSIIVPFAFDQFFWGRRLHALGVAPSPIPIGQLEAGRLADAIEATSIGGMKAKARHLAARILSEDGLTRAADLIEGYTISSPIISAVLPSGSVRRHSPRPV